MPDVSSISAAEPPILLFSSTGDWAAWLDAQPRASKGAWLKIARKGSGQSGVTYEQALRTALAFGWIDGQKRGLDDAFWLQRFTPRKGRSIWSRRNRELAEALIAGGEMRDAGRAAVEEAKANGSWDRAYDSQRTAAVPDDLRAALQSDPAAAAFFESLDSGNRYAILFRLQNAVRPETRARRLEQFVALLHRGQKIHP